MLTHKRYIFMGSMRTASANLSMIVGIEPYQDAIAIHRSNKQRMEMFCNLGSEQFSFSIEGRDHAAALNGAVLAYLIEGLVAADAAAASPSAADRRGVLEVAAGARVREARLTSWRGWWNFATAAT